MNINLEDIIKLALKTNEKDLPINQAYDIFLSYIKEYRRIGTYDFHLRIYKSLLRFYDIENIKSTKDLNTQNVYKLIAYYRAMNNKNTSINKKITHIKYLLNFLYKKDLINKIEIKVDKLNSDETRYSNLDHEQLKRVMDVIPQLNVKYQLILYLLLCTGIRRTELYHIKLNDIFLDKEFINLSFTKNHKQRNIYINKTICNLIKQHLEISKNQIYLFEDEKHTSFENPDNVYYAFKEINKLCGVNTRPHQLRHTFATNLLENNIDLESIRLLLGHSDYSMIKRYVHIKNKRLADISTSLYKI